MFGELKLLMNLGDFQKKTNNIVKHNKNTNYITIRSISILMNNNFIDNRINLKFVTP